MAARYGATIEEWGHFDLILGLTEDLLPVVSNPEAVISPNSKMKDKGKTPSRYNKQRQVAGIANWTSHISTASDIARWQKEPDYGICIQCREVRALDIDVDDVVDSTLIREFIFDWLQRKLATRFRMNSGKLLLAFRLKGEFAKRRLKVKGGIIEFLANGQQFIAVGTHPSGEKYIWHWNETDDFIELTVEEFEALWAALVAEFGIEGEEATTQEYRKRNAITTNSAPIPDHTLEHLDVLSWGKEGQAYITCPFEHEHTTDSGETATAYFPAGTRGYEQGHFVCLHAHCAHRDDAEYLDALGIRLKDFEGMEPAESEVRDEPLPMFKRDKHGTILATIGNLQMALMRSDVCKSHIRYDKFRDEIMYAPVRHPEAWRPLKDVDYVNMRLVLESGACGFAPIGREMIRDVVLSVADKNQFDSAVEWLNGLVWDGKSRVENFTHRYLGTDDNAYTRAVSMYMWTALAGRTLEPGVQVDMVPVLVGRQGLRKSSALKAIAPVKEQYGEINLLDDDDKIARLLRGVVIAEIAELRGVANGRDQESVKAIITRDREKWVPKYREMPTEYPRRCLLAGTSNEDVFLADVTGNRRWLPVQVSRMCDVDSIHQDREQLWAEARELFKLLGVQHEMAEKLAENEHDRYMIRDDWEGTIVSWLETKDLDGNAPIDRGYVKVDEVLMHALNVDVRNIKGNDGWRVGKILRSLKFTRKKMRVEGRTQWVWSNQE